MTNKIRRFGSDDGIDINIDLPKMQPGDVIHFTLSHKSGNTHKYPDRYFMIVRITDEFLNDECIEHKIAGVTP